MDRAAGDSLLCCENGALGAERQCRAYRDRALIGDHRVLANLLLAEGRYLPACSAFKCVQGEIKLPMRRVLAYWMVEVCEEHSCHDDVFPLAMNMLDRYLSVTPVKKDQLQLLGAVCLFISSKLRETRPLTAGLLVQCADCSFAVQDITDWELLVLHRLGWEVSVVTPHDFLEPLLQRLPLQRYLSPTAELDIRRQAQTFVIMCSTEHQFTQYTASAVASASIAAAVAWRGARGPVRRRRHH
ncbi:G1/S-specific cyclin-D2-like [Pollicipes pollicipes]|uniref:G1/S-specific cyclin-D2-like n=1 Tax=Pollicipes pollicipes TaxID=41117 RepID=UPI0018854AAD|nr:G1/S-specific cyclin-D2-like [Pollicipes pollicipes]